MFIRVLFVTALTTFLLVVGCDRSGGKSEAMIDNGRLEGTRSNQASSNEEYSDARTPNSSFPDRKLTLQVPGSLVEFEMILVPGDVSRNVAPFYIGKLEVTWDEFAYWALCSDVGDKKAILRREKKLRPSAPHDSESIYRGWGRDGQPAVGVSRLAAERYCQWLSEQTKRKFRLPTMGEWTSAFNQGSQLHERNDTNGLAESAWFKGNSLDEETFDNRAMPVGKLKANSLGIHDMLGNVSEWVTGTPDKKVAIGGNFLTPAEKLTGSHQVVENQSVWNKNYPNTPKSIWWYVDADFVGFRLALEAQQ